MAEEEGSVTMTEIASKPTEILETTQASVEATIESAVEGGAESTCNYGGETSGAAADGDREKTVEFSDELMERGTKSMKENDYSEAAECFSRALEIRVAHYGELAQECLNAYYQYGRALLYKAQEEADPLVSVPKKEGESNQGSDKDGSVKNAVNGESSTASVSSKTQLDGSSKYQEEGAEDDGNAILVGSALIAVRNPQTILTASQNFLKYVLEFIRDVSKTQIGKEYVSGGKDKEEDEESSDDEDTAEADEDESDLDLAWKMLDVARAIAEKHVGDTMEKVDILSTLAEVSLEREDIDTSLSDYQKALSILERLVEPDSRHIAELKPQEAIPYCQKAISVCKSRVQRLMNEVKSFSEAATSSAASELDDGIQQSSNGLQDDKLLTMKEAEIETLTDLSGDLEKKLEDLQQLVMNPKSILSEILGMASAKAKGNERSASSTVMSSSQMGTANSNGDFDSPSVSTAHTNGAAGVTHLGVVGRGVKRVTMSTGSGESSATKKPTLDHSSDIGDGDVC